MIPLVRAVVGIVLAVAVLGACASPDDTEESNATTTTLILPVSTTTGAPETTTSSTVAAVVEVRYRVERRTADEGTADFADVVHETLRDERGWQRARFRLIPDDAARYLIVIAEGPEVDRLCHPYETWSTYSCQNGPVVAINADRWRHATPKWTGDLRTYRQMLVNHEVGHLLGQHHPEVQCPLPGQLAPVMAQQSTELNGCLPNPWPLDHEIEAASRHDEPLAPPYER